MNITAIQYIRPGGRRQETDAEVSDDLADQWNLIGELEIELTLEVIPGGQVNICLDSPKLGDYRFELVPNGPEVLETVERLIREFDRHEFKAWADEMEGLQ